MKFIIHEIEFADAIPEAIFSKAALRRLEQWAEERK